MRDEDEVIGKDDYYHPSNRWKRVESPKDVAREMRALRAINAHLGVNMKKLPGHRNPIDFGGDGHCAEHKWRDIDFDLLARYGNIHFEVAKHKAIMARAAEHNEQPFFIVTLRTGHIGYCNVHLIPTNKTQLAFYGAAKKRTNTKHDDDLAYGALAHTFIWIPGSEKDYDETCQ